jgi:hypothetical protein
MVSATAARRRATVEGQVAPGFEAVRDAFAANVDRRHELGGASRTNSVSTRDTSKSRPAAELALSGESRMRTACLQPEGGRSGCDRRRCTP